MVIVFLDFDGVLNTRSSVHDGVHLESDKVVILNKICKIIKAKIVISSSWRIIYTLDEIRLLLERTGLKGTDVIGVTPVSEDDFRGDEIKTWLENNPVDRYVIIDDTDAFHHYQKKVHIQCDPYVGLTEKNAYDAVKIITEFDELMNVVAHS